MYRKQFLLEAGGGRFCRKMHKKRRKPLRRSFQLHDIYAFIISFQINGSTQLFMVRAKSPEPFPGHWLPGIHPGVAPETSWELWFGHQDLWRGGDEFQTCEASFVWSWDVRLEDWLWDCLFQTQHDWKETWQENQFLGTDPGCCVDVGSCDVCSASRFIFLPGPISNRYTSAISDAVSGETIASQNTLQIPGSCFETCLFSPLI